MKRKILIGILALMLIAVINPGIAEGQPVPSTTTPAYLPDIVNDPDYDSEELWYQQFNALANMKGFYSNYTNMFHWFGDMGINVVTHIATTHHVIGYAYSPDGVNWAIDRDWGQGADLLDFAMSEDGTTGDDGIFDVTLENNGRYFWIVALNTYHAEPLEIYARKGELQLNGTITWEAPVQTIIAANIGTKKVTWPIDAEVDSNGKLFVSFNTFVAGPIYLGYVRWTDLTNGTFTTSDTQDYDSLLDYNKADVAREYLHLNRFTNGKMAWTGVHQGAGANLWRAETVCFTGAAWITNDQHRAFGSGAAETNLYTRVDIVSYGDNLILAVTRRSVGFQRLFVHEAVYHGDWANSTELISDFPELTGNYSPNLCVDHNGNAVITIHKSGENMVNYSYRFSNYTWNMNFETLLNDTDATYGWARFTFMETTSNYFPLWFQDNTEAYTELGFHYLVWEEEELPLLFEHLNTTLYNPDGSVNDGWIFEGEVYDLESYIVLGEQFSVNTSDSYHDIDFNWNNASEQMWIIADPGDQFTIGLVHSEFERFGNVTRLLWRFIPDRSIVDSLDNAWGRTLTDGAISVYEGLGFNTSIYNLGGFTDYIFTGDGFRTPGGHPFEIYATNGTDGSSARAEQIYRKLQSIHFLVELDLSNEWDAGNGEFDIENAGEFDIGIDFRINGTWIQGWFVRISIRDSDVGHHAGGNDHNWIEWNVDWYNYNATLGAWHLRRQGTVVTNHWGYDNENLDPDHHNRTTSQLWIDLWFDRTNASTTIAGQVNAMYHGMREHGSAWWFGYGLFQPMVSDYGNSQYLDDLAVAGFNDTTSMDLELMRVYVSVDKDAVADADDEPWGIRAIENLNRKHADDRMQGVEQPAFEETLVLSMPMFQSNNPLIRAIDGISRSIWLGALGFIKILWGAMDSIFEWAGFGPGFFSLLTSYIMEIPALVIVIMENMGFLMISVVDIIESVFQVLVQILPAYVGSFGLLATSIIQYWNFFMDLMGGGFGDFSILQDIAIQDWVNFGLWMLPFYEIWNIIWAKDVTGTLKDRMEFYSMLFGGVLNFIKGLINLMGNMVQAIRSFLPI